MLREICRRHTNLLEEELTTLDRLEAQLPLMAELTGADVFIDCPSGQGMVVAAHARPSGQRSVYTGSVVGKPALRKDEPAVFHAYDSATPVSDLRAITQEGRAVLQNAVPVWGPAGRIIAVLIREQDISEDIRKERKYQALAQSHEDNGPFSGSGEGALLAVREVHHRVKNNLQLVASILRMQSRQYEDSSIRRILQENVARVLSIATIHDILTYHSNDLMHVGSRTLFDQLRINMQCLVPPGRAIAITVDGDDVPLNADTATPVSLVLTELLTNALEHAFEGRERGQVTVSLRAGTLRHTVTVADDGVGFAPQEQSGPRMGLHIVSATVRDKLDGNLRIRSDGSGTRVSFDFRA